MWVRLFHWFWRHKVSWEPWGCSKCVWLILLGVFFYLNVFLRWRSEFRSQPFVTAYVPDLHELSMKVVFQICLLVCWEKLFDLGSVSAILWGVESDHKDIFFFFRYKILNLWDLFPVSNHNTGVTVVLAKYIFKSRYVFVWYKRDNIAHIIKELDFQVGVVGFFVKEESFFRLLVIEGVRKFLIVTVVNDWNWRAFVFKSWSQAYAVLIVSDAFIFGVKLCNNFLQVRHFLDLTCNVWLVGFKQLFLGSIIF